MGLKKILAGLTITFLITFYLWLAVSHSNKVNVSIDYPDQKPYVEAAIRVHESNFRYLGDRNRMPIYPYIQAFFFTPGMSENDFFLQGKLINIFLSLVFLGVIYLIVSKYLDSLCILNFMLITSFAFFVLKAAYFQVELLFYTLSFLAFILFIKTIRKPSLKNGFLTGFVVALAYLSKATSLLGFMIFTLFQLSRFVYNFYKRSGNVKTIAISTISSVLVFLLILSPYISENKRIYGKYFYNLSTTFYVWYDSIDDAISGTSAHGDTLSWPDLPENQIPSFGKYFKEHTGQQSLQRLGMGFLKVLLFISWTYASVPSSFLFLSLLFLAFSGVIQKDQLKYFIKKDISLLIFFAIYFTVHILAFSWYAVIDSGPRFILTLYLPALFLVFLTFTRLARLNGPQFQKLFHFIILFALIVGMKISIIPIISNIFTGF